MTPDPTERPHSYIQRAPVELAAWLDALPHRTGWQHKVDELLPSGYPVYLRLFHGFFPCDTDERTYRGRPASTWHDLVSGENILFGPTLTLRQISSVPAPAGIETLCTFEGTLDLWTADVLYAMLRKHLQSDVVYYFYDLAAIMWADGRTVLKSEGLTPLDQLHTAIEQYSNQWLPGPEWIWPENREWILNTDYDLTSTYLAVSNELAEEILAHPDLEVVQVTLNTRIDSTADEEPTG